jgi:hypothetical protein
MEAHPSPAYVITPKKQVAGLESVHPVFEDDSVAKTSCGASLAQTEGECKKLNDSAQRFRSNNRYVRALSAAELTNCCCNITLYRGSKFARHFAQSGSLRSTLICMLLTDSEPVAPSTWSVFLSSTVRDFEEFRREVQIALLKKAEAACFLSEDWLGGYNDTVETCKSRVLKANGFFLLLGYWYGSIPPGRKRSIIHLEFEWAKKRWKHLKFPPVAVMVPKVPSEAEQKLKHAAGIILKDKVKKKEIDEARHGILLEGFHATVKDTWRTCIPFEDKHDLRENVIVKCLEWKGQTPMAAAHRKIVTEAIVPTDSQVKDEQLGQLGRQPQFDAIESVLAVVADHADVPAVAMNVYGDQDAGQRAFLSRLIKTTLKSHYPRSRLNRLPLSHNDPVVLTSWVAGQLGIARGIGTQNPEQLAERVGAELQRQPLYFVLDRIADLAGGVQTFRETFWAPFYEKLRALRADRKFDNRLIAVVVDYSGDETGWQSATCAWDAEEHMIDYSRLLLIPKLGAFRRIDVLKWLREMEVPDKPTGRRKVLVDRALKNDHDVEDPVPIRVFGRLKGETLWPQREQE